MITEGGAVMESDAGNIHYLKPTRSTNGSTATGEEQILQKVEQHLERMEQEFKRTVRRLSKHPPASKSSSGEDLQRLIVTLEERLKNLSDQVRQTGHYRRRNPALQQAAEWFGRIKKAVSTGVFKEFLHTVWFGGSQEENFEFDEFGLDPQFMRKVKPFFDFLYHDYWRVSVKGIHHIPREGRGLIVSNHSGTVPYDGAMIRLSVLNDHPSRRDVRFLVEDFVYHFPFLGTFMYRTGGVRACPENAERLLRKDHLVAVFPEGVKGIGKEFKHRYRLQRFGRGGFIKLALKTGSPIIPAAVIGAEEIHPILYKSTALAKPLGIPYIPITPTLPWLGPFGLIPLPSKWTIVFGEPILLAGHGPKDLDDQLLINQLSENVRTTIQEKMTEELKNRRSVWFG